MTTNTQWYLLQCKPNQQARAELNLDQQAVQCYSPTRPVKRKVRGKIALVDEVLFPGYVFINLHAQNDWRAIHATRGVSRVVSFNGTPHPVPASLIAALQQRVAQASEPAPLFKKGERVTVTEGCFQHVEAIVQGVSADERIIVLMKILQTQQTIKIPPTQLAKAS